MCSSDLERTHTHNVIDTHEATGPPGTHTQDIILYIYTHTLHYICMCIGDGIRKDFTIGIVYEMIFEYPDNLFIYFYAVLL